MNRVLSMLALLLVATNLGAQAPQDDSRPSATTQQGPQLAGTWTLVSVDNLLPDGRRIQPYGPHPVGQLTLDARGRYSVLIFRPDRARFGSNDKNRGTDEENRATVQGTNSHFGRYSIDETQRTLTFHIDHASFPNWQGTEQRRSYTLTGDELRYTVRTTTTGGPEIGEVTWRRAP